MNGKFKRYIQTVCWLLIGATFCGILPWRELRADANTHGDYESYPFTITYEQNSTWNNSTQGQYTLTNISDYEVSSWTLEIDYFEVVTLSNIWNSQDIVAPQVPATDGSTLGASTNIDPRNTNLSGNCFFIRANTPMPRGLGVVADGMDVNPNSPHGIGHHTIFPTEPMSVNEFNRRFHSLPWQLWTEN